MGLGLCGALLSQGGFNPGDFTPDCPDLARFLQLANLLLQAEVEGLLLKLLLTGGELVHR